MTSKNELFYSTLRDIIKQTGLKPSDVYTNIDRGFYIYIGDERKEPVQAEGTRLVGIQGECDFWIYLVLDKSKDLQEIGKQREQGHYYIDWIEGLFLNINYKTLVFEFKKNDVKLYEGSIKFIELAANYKAIDEDKKTFEILFVGKIYYIMKGF